MIKNCFCGSVSSQSKLALFALAWWLRARGMKRRGGWCKIGTSTRCDRSSSFIAGGSHRWHLRRCACRRRCHSYARAEHDAGRRVRRGDGHCAPRRSRWCWRRTPSPTRGGGGCDCGGLVGRVGFWPPASGRRWRMRFPGWRGAERGACPLLLSSNGKLSSARETRAGPDCRYRYYLPNSIPSLDSFVGINQ